MKNSKDPFVITIPIYNGIDLMDVAAPREVFGWMNASGFDRKVEVYCVSNRRTVITRDGLKVRRHKSLRSPKVMHPDLIWVPGGEPNMLAQMLQKPDSAFFRYVKLAGLTATYVTSVCEGAILLAQTGLLDGYEATTHWAFYPCMAAFPNVNMVQPTVSTDPNSKETTYTYPRYIHSGNRVTGGGISSGLDEAFYLVKLIGGENGEKIAEQAAATMQYFPEPPVTGVIAPTNSCPVPGLIS